jgi:hypothetical protein
MRRSNYPPKRTRGASGRPAHYSRKTSSRPPPLVLRTRRPLAAVLVAIDCAKRSGCATYALGRLHNYAEIKAHEHPHERLEYLQRALAYAVLLAVPCGLVLEVPFSSTRGGSRAAERSLTASVTLWRDSWLQLRQKLEHVHEVEAGDWRRALFGSGSMPREAQQRLEALAAVQIVERDRRAGALLTLEAVGSDAAAAICLGATCTHSLDLQKALECQLIALPTS